MAVTIRKSIEDVIREDGRYPSQAFAFLHEGLSLAVTQAHGSKGDKDDSDDKGSFTRHVTGGQLCWSLRELAIDRYGLLARSVLERWNICSTADFGNMVYLLVDNGMMKKTDSDSIDDFRNVYSFDTAFEVDLTPEIT